jgi:acetyl-CoA acyltransferase
MNKRVVVAGVGMIPFTTPKNSEPYHVMGEAAGRTVLDDAGVAYASVQRGCVGYVYGDSTSGQAALYGLGQTGIPIINVNDTCSTGSSALFMGAQRSDEGTDRALAVAPEPRSPHVSDPVPAPKPAAESRSPGHHLP